MEKKKRITARMMKKLQSDLKELNMQWVELLVKQMTSDKAIAKVFKKVNDRKIYNVFNGVVTNGAWKVEIYKQACSLKEKLEQQLQEAVS